MPDAPERLAEEFACMVMDGARRSYRAVMELRNASGEAMVLMVSPALADAHDRHVAIVQDAAENALVDVDALDLVERSSRRCGA